MSLLVDWLRTGRWGEWIAGCKDSSWCQGFFSCMVVICTHLWPVDWGAKWYQQRQDLCCAAPFHQQLLLAHFFEGLKGLIKVSSVSSRSHVGSVRWNASSIHHPTKSTPSSTIPWKILVYPLVINLGEVNSCLFVLGLTSNICRRSYIFL